MAQAQSRCARATMLASLAGINHQKACMGERWAQLQDQPYPAALSMQVALIVPFMGLGEVVLREKHLTLSPVSLRDIIFKHPGAESGHLSSCSNRLKARHRR